MKKVVLIFCVLPLLFVFIGFSVFSLNGLIDLDETVKAKWSRVLNQYQRRTDLIPNLVETVKGYANHEKETLTAVIEARNKATQLVVKADNLSDTEAMQNFMLAQSQVQSSLGRLMAVSEGYPNLKADANFLSLQAELRDTEDKLADARDVYIDAISDFNVRVRKIPARWIVALFSDMKPKANFDIDKKAMERPIVNFSK